LSKSHSSEAAGTVWCIGQSLIVLGAYWCIAGIVLWWSYDISPLILGGHYQRRQALAIVAKMALIVTVLTSLVWLFVMMRKVSGSRWRIAWNIGWKTAVFLLAYAIVVVTQRQLWNPSQGINDNAMFLPLIGNVNGRFFSEAGTLLFILEIVPIMACVSGLLCALQPRCFMASSSRIVK
jgi:hypothetical protein